MRTVLVLLLLTLGLAACGTDDTTSSNPATEAATANAPTEAEGTDPATPQPTTTTDAPVDGTEDPAAASGPADEGTPMPVEGEGGIGDGTSGSAPLTEAPDFGISSETDSGSISPFTSCWQTPTGGTATEGTCTDGTPHPDSLVLEGADQLVVTYAEGQLSATSAAPGATSDTDLPVEQENPGIWLVDTSDLAAGDHVITMSWRGDQGDAFTSFTLSVVR